MNASNDISFTFAITVCDELFEFKQLLQNILSQIENCDEILVICDTSKNKLDDVKQILEQEYIKYTLIPTTLNKDFATFKNNIVTNATKDYIVQIDADEFPCANFVTNLRQIFELNPQIDCYTVARENYVNGITEQYLKQMSWRIDDKSRINFPDRQFRIFKNNGKIFWKNPVHEVLDGWRIVSNLPESLFLMHVKSIDKQMSQNEFYAQNF